MTTEQLILDNVKDIKKEVSEVRKEVFQLKTEVAVIKSKSAFWGSVGGSLSGLLAVAIIYMVKSVLGI